ncbi:hypothetical protein [Actinotignum urinale]|uniref:hypothetical protein n=1 Tax=Actinotignum urinale TaxID=190146 RepID=UPI0003B55BD7|nr:hypothetical protein [Actinotignum urinale]MDY5161129.1 toxin [Actinotignum urinale]
MISFTESAFRHGLREEDIIRAWHTYWKQIIEEEEPLKVIRLGYDTRARLLEIGAQVARNGNIKIFHAMRARKRYIYTT